MVRPNLCLFPLEFEFLAVTNVAELLVFLLHWFHA